MKKITKDYIEDMITKTKELYHMYKNYRDDTCENKYSDEYKHYDVTLTQLEFMIGKLTMELEE